MAHIEGSQVIHIFLNIVFLSQKINFVLGNSAEPHDMQYYALLLWQPEVCMKLKSLRKVVRGPSKNHSCEVQRFPLLHRLVLDHDIIFYF